MCPNLQTVCALVADNNMTKAVCQSQAGAIMSLDILYGHSAALKAGYHFMTHKNSFAKKSLN